MLKIGKYKNLFDNCCVVIAIGLIVFLTIDLYMFNTLEGNWFTSLVRVVSSIIKKRKSG